MNVSHRVGTVQRKVLLLLLGGLALGLSGSPARYFRILKMMGREWRDINRQALWRAIRALYQSRLIKTVYNTDGTITLILSEDGKKRALTCKIDTMTIGRPEKWDGKWRVVIFDVPERRRKVRDALRYHLRQLGFFELQKSVFVHPYPCTDEIDFLVEGYHIRSHVRQIVADKIDNEPHLRQKFDLLSRSRT